MRGRKIGVGLAIAVVVVALAVGIGIRQFVETPQRTMSAGVSGPVKSSGTARIGGAFSMIDHRGQPVTDRDFLGKFMLVYFGYTFCPDVCPTELQSMSEALDSLGPAADRIRPVFVTIDPERDTVEVLADYLPNFRSGFVGLTGTAKQVADTARTYGVYYSKVKSRNAPDDDKDYLMSHSSFVFLMDDKGKFRAAFRSGVASGGMARRLRSELAK